MLMEICYKEGGREAAAKGKGAAERQRPKSNGIWGWAADGNTGLIRI